MDKNAFWDARHLWELLIPHTPPVRRESFAALKTAREIDSLHSVLSLLVLQDTRASWQMVNSQDGPGCVARPAVAMEGKKEATAAVPGLYALYPFPNISKQDTHLRRNHRYLSASLSDHGSKVLKQRCQACIPLKDVLWLVEGNCTDSADACKFELSTSWGVELSERACGIAYRIKDIFDWLLQLKLFFQVIQVFFPGAACL